MKTMKDFAAQQLTKKQMNDVKGGAVESKYCNPGEKLYTCVATFGKNESSGVVCARQQAEAMIMVAQTMVDENQHLMFDRLTCE